MKKIILLASSALFLLSNVSLAETTKEKHKPLLNNYVDQNYSKDHSSSKKEDKQIYLDTKENKDHPSKKEDKQIYLDTKEGKHDYYKRDSQKFKSLAKPVQDEINQHAENVKKLNDQKRSLRDSLSPEAKQYMQGLKEENKKHHKK
jgi:vacuolar-type H+-ATPase subunit I/STV1